MVQLIKRVLQSQIVTITLGVAALSQLHVKVDTGRERDPEI